MDDKDGALALVVRRNIRATPERLFAAWTTPAQLLAWWGPRGAACTEAVIEARVGAIWRIANRFDDGKTVWLSGEVVEVTRPKKLVLTWRVDDGAEELLTVRFDGRDDGTTDVVIVHQRVATAEARRSHEAGWDACLAGLARYAG